MGLRRFDMKRHALVSCAFANRSGAPLANARQRTIETDDDVRGARPSGRPSDGSLTSPTCSRPPVLDGSYVAR